MNIYLLGIKNDVGIRNLYKFYRLEPSQNKLRKFKGASNLIIFIKTESSKQILIQQHPVSLNLISIHKKKNKRKCANFVLSMKSSCTLSLSLLICFNCSSKILRFTTLAYIKRLLLQVNIKTRARVLNTDLLPCIFEFQFSGILLF